MTINTDRWGELEEAPDTPHHDPTIQATSPAQRLEPLAELAELFVHLKAAHEETRAKLDQVAHEIIHFFPEEAGDISQFVPAYEITVSRKEQWSWDQEILDRAFLAKDSPDYIKRKLSIDKRKFQTLPASEQQRFKHALTRKLSNPKVTVIPNV